MASFILTQAEMAVLTEHMLGGSLPLDQVAHADLALDPELVRLAEEHLLERGLLVRAPLEATAGVSSELAFLLGAALNPDSVCVLRVTRRDSGAVTFYFSFSAPWITLNYVDAQDFHVLTELDGLDHALDQMLFACDMQLDQSIRPASEVAQLFQLLKDARTLVLLLVVTDLINPHSTTHTLSWLEAHGGVWVIDGATRTPLAQRIDLDQLRAIIAALLSNDRVYHA